MEEQKKETLELTGPITMEQFDRLREQIEIEGKEKEERYVSAVGAFMHKISQGEYSEERVQQIRAKVEQEHAQRFWFDPFDRTIAQRIYVAMMARCQRLRIVRTTLIDLITKEEREFTENNSTQNVLWVSTVALYGFETPMYETMIFGGDRHLDQVFEVRYKCREFAEIGHEETLAYIRKHVGEPCEDCVARGTYNPSGELDSNKMMAYVLQAEEES